MFSYMVSAQSRTQQGAVLKRGGSVRISGAIVENRKSGVSVLSNQLGFFSIMANPGDTISVSSVGYTRYAFVVSDFKDQIVYLIPITNLDAVVVQGKSLETELRETQNDFRRHGVFYEGKPPLLLAVTNPITAINELFSKSAKRARRFHEYAENELEYQEISKRFNERTIRTAVPGISDDDLPLFRSEYLPSVDQIRQWSDYDIIVYIKSSYKTYLEIKETEAREKSEAAQKTAKDSIAAPQK